MARDTSTVAKMLEGKTVHPDVSLVVAPGSRQALQMITESGALASLIAAKGRVKTRDALLDEIRDRNYEVFDRSIDVHISALRKKLGDDPKNPRFIRTVRAVGYILNEEMTNNQ